MRYILFLFLGMLAACNQPQEDGSNDQTITATKSKAHLIEHSDKQAIVDAIPSLKAYQTKVEEVLSSILPIVQFDENDVRDNRALIAQDIALHDVRFLKNLTEKDLQKNLHNEITNIAAVPQNVLLRKKINCKTGNCYEVEMYNFFYNSVTKAIVDIERKRVLAVEHLPATTPTISQRLGNLAKKIVLNNNDIAQLVGYKEGELFTNYQIKIQESKCERNRHLCIGVLFESDEKTLWTIVDMNDAHVMGWQWVNNPDEKRPVIITGRTLQNDFVMENYCGTLNTITQNDWEVNYELTSSDGVEIKNVKYKGEEIIRSAKLVDWHVNYKFKEGFGYSDAMGCPMFSSAAVVAFEGPSTRPIYENGQEVGFAFIQDFRSPVWPLACNYRYENRYEFYFDGSFRITGVNQGLGCGEDGWYRPVLRIDLTPADDQKETFAQWDGQQWQTWDKEQWNRQQANSKYTPEGYLYSIQTGSNKGYYIEPGNGQFNDGGRGDNAYTYLVKLNKGEGEEDLPTFGQCCNDNHEQGPEQFIDDKDNVVNEDLVIWYVPEMVNDNRPGKEYCWAKIDVENGKPSFLTWQGVIGPKFIPYTK